MTEYHFYIILNHSILLAGILGIIRCKVILKTYYPFLFFIWLACINETLSLVMIYTEGGNAVNSNIYVLSEYLILLYQFYKWNGCNAKKFIFFALFGTVIWITDNFMINAITDNNSVFRSYYSFIILLYAIDRINSIIVQERKSLLKNAVFLICVAFLPYYGSKAFVEVINIFNLPFSYVFYRHVWLTLSLINCLSNIVYAIAVICIPTKQEFTLPY